MNTHKHKLQAKKNGTAANTQQQKSNAVQLEDNRPGTVVQGKLKSGVSKNAPVIQRYAIVQPGNIRAQNNTTVETQDIARTPYSSTYVTKSTRTTQTGFNPTAQQTTTERVSGVQNVAPSNLPSFRVSQHGLMAVANQGQAKNFYTTDGKVNSANAKFISGGAPIRLVTQGNGITVPKNPVHPNNHQTNKLKKVHAAMEVTNQITNQVHTQIQQAFPQVQCNDFIKLITNAAGNVSRVAILNGSQQTQQVIAEEGTEPVSNISTLISGGNVTPGQAQHHVQNTVLDGPQTETGLRNYERLSDTTRTKRARKLGINEFASPGVGEGLVIRSQNTNEKYNTPGVSPLSPQIVPHGTNNAKKRKRLRQQYSQSLQDLANANAIVNHSKLNVPLKIQNMMPVWGVHYAGVVGRDGPDMVTLENYNRVTEVRWEHERIFNNLFQNFADFRNFVSDRVDSFNTVPDEQTIQQLVQFALAAPGLVGGAYQTALQQAQQSFNTGLQQTQQTFNGNFYFDMYGPGAQSFHARYKALTSNPVTLHIREDLQIIIQSATDNINDLQNRIIRWETPVLAHPLTGPAHTGIHAVINHARGVLQQCITNRGNATTRAQYGKIVTEANNEWNLMGQQIGPAIMNAYQQVTGNAPVPAAHNFNDLDARCTTYLNTYSWYHFTTARYTNMVNLHALAQALHGLGLVP